MLASTWHPAEPLGLVLGRDSLIDAGIPFAQQKHTAGQIESPEPVLFFADLTDRLFAIRLQPLAPVPTRHRVVIAPPFHIMHVKATALHALDHVPEMIEFAAREDVLGQ